ncbi:MAG: proline/glycine betaine ABC transporter substrate-binding protein ProX [Candidimonas sp.]|nr:MAG: proline/glycine betaine ABC transporter substrate-binding protein ProX [Candidimonas sp.]TAM18714.1 MAG: proline/glycine betaine ABC transporter substrate-binding protein ProX [Candidimonas sp.]
MAIRMITHRFLKYGLMLTLASTAFYAQAAKVLPGNGVVVIPVQTAQQEEAFQTRIVIQGLKDLGYTVKPTMELEYATATVAVANGDATFFADNWVPLHDSFYKNAGGDAKLSHKGTLASGALQGYLIDKKTADKYKITNLGQLKDPAIAKLFDTNGDGKADLAGCTPGWGCEKAIEYQLDAYHLRPTVVQNEGSYAALMADVFTRFKEGKPVLYYTWTPYYVSAVLVPGKDVVWLQVPFSAVAGNPKESTKLSNGKDYGFPLNTIHVLANKAFVKANPVAGKFFELVHININDINAQNNRMHAGQNTSADIDRDVANWIKANQKTWDGWIAASAAAKKS